MKKNKLFIKALALFLIILCVFPLLVSCKGRPLSQTSLAKKEVGKVGDYTVQYEEFYFVASNYYAAMKDKYGNDTEGLKKAVWEKTVQTLASNYYATLALCEEEGVEYNPEDLKDEINNIVEKQIKENFNGSRSKYFKSQQKAGLTDHYVRFTLGVEIMYNRLVEEYKKRDVIPNTKEKARKYIKENFIHTWHIAVVVDENESRDEEFNKAQRYLDSLNNGTKFFDLMTYNEDFASESLVDVYGIYFHPGEMDKEYEDAALALGTSGNDYSDIIESTAVLDDGSTRECFYIIQRLTVKDPEIDKNFETLRTRMGAAIIAQKVEAIKKSLSFVPNDYAKGLDVTNLKQPKNGVDYYVIYIVVACVFICAISVALLIFYRKSKLKKFNQLKNLK